MPAGSGVSGCRSQPRHSPQKQLFAAATKQITRITPQPGDGLVPEKPPAGLVPWHWLSGFPPGFVDAITKTWGKSKPPDPQSIETIPIKLLEKSPRPCKSTQKSLVAADPLAPATARGSIRDAQLHPVPNDAAESTGNHCWDKPEGGVLHARAPDHF